MKKFLALLLAVVMVLTMVACGEGKKKADGQVVSVLLPKLPATGPIPLSQETPMPPIMRS